MLPYTFGVEIECFGVPVPVVVWAFRKAGLTAVDTMSPGVARDEDWNRAARGQYDDRCWVIGGDGSIRGAHPMEIKSPILKGQEGIKALRTAVRVLNKIGCKVNNSTGLHVHVGVKNADTEHRHTPATVLEVLKRYDTHLSTIEGFIHADRRGGANQFCQPIKAVVTTMAPVVDASVERVMFNGYDLTGYRLAHNWNEMSAAQKHDWIQYNIGPVPRGTSRHTSGAATLDTIHQYGNHYDAVSIYSLGKYGTIEFRQHHGSMDAAEVCAWVMFVVNHVEQARLAVVRRQAIVSETRGRKPSLFTGLPSGVRKHLEARLAASRAPATAVV
jgi:hypothetical protein